MKTGIVFKAYSGFYYIKDENDAVYECKLRGRFKKDKNNAIPGDWVNFEDLGQGSGVIEEILPRKTLLTRPMVANVEQVIVTFAAKNPDISLKLLDQFLLMVEASELKTVICINKVDLVEIAELEEMLRLYQEIGYPIIYCSAKAGIGLPELRAVLKDKISVFAGASGVGKSALLNAVQPGLKLETGELSDKIKRGTHTTRRVELLPLHFGGMVADTPGFSAFEMEFLTPEELPYLFPEMVEFLGQCHYQDCAHTHEPGCNVKMAVEEGKISRHRYQNYVEFMKEVLEIQERERGY